MAIVTEERVMAKAKGRPKTSQRQDQTAKIDRGVMVKAKFVADHRGIPVAELLTELLRAPVDREFTKAVKEVSERGGQA